MVPPAPDEVCCARAQAAFACADYQRVLELARRHPDNALLVGLAVRAVFNLRGAEAARRACEQALTAHPGRAELHYLHALSLFEAEQLSEARTAVQRALYLDRSLSVALFTQGAIVERLQDFTGARRAYASALSLLGKRPPDEPVPLGDGITTAGLASACSRALCLLDQRGHA